MKPNYFIYLALFFLSACGSESTPDIAECAASNTINWEALNTLNCDDLSDYGLFQNSKNPTQQPKTPGVLYSLNSTLFTDFAHKYRYVFIPDGKKIYFKNMDVFDLPIGSVLVKVFALPDNSSETIIEVRLLIHRENGWVTLPYQWNTQTLDAKLNLNGASIPFEMNYQEQFYAGTYVIPTYGDCQTCHMDNNTNQPIGPKARNLNKPIEYDGQFMNQLTLWKNLNLLDGLPDDLSSIDTAPDWQDENANLQDRAKAYLDVNCAHCHSDGGAGALSGLRLEYWRKDIDYSHGVCNSSHGWRGGGFDIWPGDGEISSIPIRMRHTDPKDRMPPIGRSLVDEQAAALVSSWIDSLPYESCAE